MGGHIYRCQQCGGETPLYNSCGDRHCPKCQGRKRAAWLEARQAELLPVEYFHVVFTVPHQLAPAAQAHPADFYPLLFRAVRETLLEVGAAKEHLGAQLGGVMVLHTWGQTLELHPHVHAIVPGGGLALDGQSWKACPAGFFLPVEVLSRVFRGKLLDYFKQANQAGELPWTGGLARLAQPEEFQQYLSDLYGRDWVVYAKPAANGPEAALKYLARYTYRVAIANNRLESLENGRVTFRYRDYTQDGRWRSMTLEAHEFLRRFLLHVLPKGLVRIRSFGFLASRHRAARLARCRELLASRGRDNVRIRPPGRSSGPGNRTGNRISDGTATLSSLRPR